MNFLLSWLEVNGSALTHGARALAKHAERSSNKYWGIISGSGECLMRILNWVLEPTIFLSPGSLCLFAAFYVISSNMLLSAIKYWCIFLDMQKE